MRYAVAGGAVDLVVEVEDGAAPGRYRVRVNGKEYDVRWTPRFGFPDRLRAATHWLVDQGTGPQAVVVEPEGDILGVTLGVDHLDLTVRLALPLGRRGAGPAAEAAIVEVRAPMPGLLVSVTVTPGERIEGGRPVAVIEAMKMQMELPAPASGEVREVRAAPGKEVGAGEVIVVVVPQAGGPPPVSGGP